MTQFDLDGYEGDPIAFIFELRNFILECKEEFYNPHFLFDVRSLANKVVYVTETPHKLYQPFDIVPQRISAYPPEKRRIQLKSGWCISDSKLILEISHFGVAVDSFSIFFSKLFDSSIDFSGAEFQFFLKNTAGIYELLSRLDIPAQAEVLKSLKYSGRSPTKKGRWKRYAFEKVLRFPVNTTKEYQKELDSLLDILPQQKSFEARRALRFYLDGDKLRFYFDLRPPKPDRETYGLPTLATISFSVKVEHKKSLSVIFGPIEPIKKRIMKQLINV